jgi:hypothetical protein
MTPEVRGHLEALRDKTNAATLAEVIRRALALYEVLWTEHSEGGQIIIRKGDDEQQILPLF